MTLTRADLDAAVAVCGGQVALARRLKINPRTVRRWCAGTHYPRDTSTRERLARLAKQAPRDQQPA